LVFSSPALGQATPAESPTLQAMLAEIRQLRQDLQTSAIAARRAQILIYRFTRTGGRRCPCFPAGWMKRNRQPSSCGLRTKYQEIQIKQYETLEESSRECRPTAAIRGRDLELKAQTEALAVEEQEVHMKETELEQQSRIEQAKLDQLQDELDRLDEQS